MRKFFAFLLAAALLLAVPAAAEGTEYAAAEAESDGAEVDVSAFGEARSAESPADIDISAPSAILMEKETGTVLYEKDADRKLEPASVTKVMTILLIAEAVEAGTLKLDDMVTASAEAAGMGGSQVFLKEGEQMSADEMLKCIVVSSANDAAVAMAEHIAGTEQAFVARMNKRAAELGCANTNFTSCTGLLDDASHLTTARDVAVMSRELLRHGWIRKYTTIWMDTIRGGAFGLSNTNKLIYYYKGATGLKTGFTRAAGYCLSATAERDGVEYIAVVMGCADSKGRFESAKTLLSYGFANYALVDAAPSEALPPVPVTLGKAETVQPLIPDAGKLLVVRGEAGAVKKSVVLAGSVAAPVEAGQKLGTLTVTDGAGKTLLEKDVVAAEGVERLTWKDVFAQMMRLFFFGGF